MDQANKDKIKPFTTEDVVKILFYGSQDQIDKTSDMLKTADEYKKHALLRILWEEFCNYKEELAKLKFEQFFQEAKQGKRKLTADMMTQARREIGDLFRGILSGRQVEIDKMEEIRAKIRTTIGEGSDQIDQKENLTPLQTGTTQTGPTPPTQS